MGKLILMPLPSYGFDPTETAIPWKILTGKGFTVVFSTPQAKPAEADRLMLLGENLGIWKPILKARSDAVDAYKEMGNSQEFQKPISYFEVKVEDFDGLVLPGGHDKGMVEYLESKTLQNVAVDFFLANKTVGAICHGMILAARSINEKTGKSVINDYRVTALLKSQEMAAYNMTRLWLGDYYLTYPGLTVEEEVRSVLAKATNFKKGPLPMHRDDLSNLSRGFYVKDRNFISSRWPGDAYSFSIAYADMF